MVKGYVAKHNQKFTLKVVEGCTCARGQHCHSKSVNKFCNHNEEVEVCDVSCLLESDPDIFLI